MVWSANPNSSGTRPHQRRARSAEAISIITILLCLARSNFLLILSYRALISLPWWDCGRIHYADVMLKGQIIGMNVLTSRHWFQNSCAEFNWTTHFQFLQPSIHVTRNCNKSFPHNGQARLLYRASSNWIIAAFQMFYRLIVNYD